MADDLGEKTEQATPKRRSESRQKGQVAKSQDLTSAVLLLTGFLALTVFGPGIWLSLLAIVRTGLAPDSPASMDEYYVSTEQRLYQPNQG